MATKILIKRTTGSGDPTLVDGELAYVNGTEKLLYGFGSSPTTLKTIGGKVFADKLDHTNGLLNASSAIVTDANSKVDSIKLRGINNSTPGNIVLDDNDSTNTTTLKGAATLGGNIDITLPTTAGTLVGTGDTGSVSNTMLAGSIPNSKLANSSLQVGSTSISLGGQATTIAGVQDLTVDEINLNAGTISTTSGNLTLSPNGTNTVDVANSRITSLSEPTADNNAATKAYVDGRVNGLEIKESVKVATTAAITGVTYDNSGGTLTKNSNGAIGNIDGIALTTNDRILVKNQGGADPNGAHLQNGIYKVSTVGDGSNPFVLIRTDDADAASEITGGSFFFVEQGTVNADNGFVTTHNGTPTLGTTAIAFQQFSGAGQITAGDGLQKSGNVISVDLKANSGLEINGGEIRLNLGASTINGVLGVADGGTGESTFVANRILIGNGTSAFNQVAIGNSGEFLISNGSGSAPSFTDTIDGGTYS